MKRVCAIALICLFTMPFQPNTAHAQTGPHFVSTVLSESSPVIDQYGYTFVSSEIWRHSVTNGGNVLIWMYDDKWDDGYNFDRQATLVTNVYGADWTYGWQDIMWAENSGVSWDNGDGSTTIYRCLTYSINDSGLLNGGCHYYWALNSTLAASQAMSVQNLMTMLDGCHCGNTSERTRPVPKSGLAKLLDYFFPTVYAWTVNWKCVWLAATDPICDEMEVIFPGAGLTCMIVIYELCTQVENLGPGGKGHALNRTPL